LLIGVLPDGNADDIEFLRALQGEFAARTEVKHAVSVQGTVAECATTVHRHRHPEQSRAGPGLPLFDYRLRCDLAKNLHVPDPYLRQRSLETAGTDLVVVLVPFAKVGGVLIDIAGNQFLIRMLPLQTSRGMNRSLGQWQPAQGFGIRHQENGLGWKHRKFNPNAHSLAGSP
jgi:hypothetical protein